MKVAGIVITYNDGFKLKEWHKHYQVYKDELYKMIIVDNGSEQAYLDKVKELFKEAIIIERTSNGGTTAAYNDGIRLALEDEQVDAIMLVGNDIRLEKGGVTQLYQFLQSDVELGMVEPIILSKGGNIVEDFGCDISRVLTMIPYGVGKDLAELKETRRIVTAVTGGMNMSSRKFYETVGLQDENLFMYSDEVDMGLRARKAGFKMGVDANTLSWHEHINPPGKGVRPVYAPFLTARNKVYLSYKHFNFFKSLFVWSYFSMVAVFLILREKKTKENFNYYWHSIKGAAYGLFKKMSIPTYMVG